jgi:hypothetical protein
MFYYRHVTAFKIIGPILLVVGALCYLAGISCSNYSVDCSCGITICASNTPNWALAIIGIVPLFSAIIVIGYTRIIHA